MTTGCQESVMITGNQDSAMRIDGGFEDWKDVKVLATDPKGDAKSVFDLTCVYAASRGSILYLRFDTGNMVNLQNGPKSEETLLVKIGLPDDRQLILDTRGRRAYLNDDSKERIPWGQLKYLVGPTYAQDEFEIQIDLGKFDVKPGSSVSIQFDGSDQLRAPVSYTFSSPATEPKRRSTGRLAGTDVRVVSLNTFFGGLNDEKRIDNIERLLNFADGDIYCFQEEWNTPDIDKVMNRLIPLENGSQWNVHNVNGRSTVVASKYPMKALPASNNHYTVARIEIKGKRLYVISIHLSAMGYINSSEDSSRLWQAKEVMETIAGINNGQYDQGDLTSKPGIVIIGDFNLVGSRTPLDIMIDNKDDKLDSWMVPNLIGESIITWSGARPNASFTSGKLDYIVYSPETLQPKNGFLLDSSLLNQTELKQFKLNADDSKATDHMLIITDYQFLY
jgi:endonuclease/exonuclease/phosphatase family metal-dependent hydrolase